VDNFRKTARARLMRSRCISSRRVPLVLALLLAVTGCGGSGDDRASGEKKRIILISNAETPFWDAVRAGLKAAEKDLNLAEAGLTAVVQPTDGTSEKQLSLLRQFATQSDVAAVAVSVAEASSVPLAEELKKLRGRGIPVIAFDSDVDRKRFRDARLAFVGTDNRVAGIELGKAAGNLLPDGGGFVTFVGVTSAQNAIERVSGFAEGAGPKFTPLDNMPDGVDPIRMRDNVHNAILNHAEKLKALVGIWSSNGPAIVDVVRREGNRRKFKILAFDAEPNTIQAMSEGDVDAMVVQNPYRMGYESVRLLAALVRSDEATRNEMLPHLDGPGGDIYDTGLKIVVPDDGSPLTPEMFDKAEFFKLSQFRRWLAERNLSGS